MYSLFADGNKITPRARHAFTLTELAIVLGVIGMILGAIWSAASSVYSNNRVSKAVTEVISIANGVRATFGTKGSFPAGGLDITQAMVNMNTAYLPNMLETTCPGTGSYNVTLNACPVDPWGGGAVQVGYGTGWWGSPDATNSNEFTIMFWDGSVKDCPAFMAQMVEAASSAHIVWGYAAPVGATAGAPTVATFESCTGYMTLTFPL
jgi:prepilin-type N-terminal cleavage/methylation domain-containing protein